MAVGRPAIILKLDDVTHEGAEPGHGVGANWRRCVALLRSIGVPAALGVIGYSLEADAPAYVDWLRATAAAGDVEFWNHGYRCRRSTDEPAEFEGPLAGQVAALLRTQQLGRERLGLTFRAFGPHWSGTNDATNEALAAVPDLRVVFAQPDAPRGGQRVLRRRIELEQPIFHPDARTMLRDFDRDYAGHAYVTLQGHPPAWDDARFAEFARAIEGLIDRGCTFTTPAQYLDALAICAPRAGRATALSET